MGSEALVEMMCSRVAASNAALVAPLAVSDPQAAAALLGCCTSSADLGGHAGDVLAAAPRWVADIWLAEHAVDGDPLGQWVRLGDGDTMDPSVHQRLLAAALGDGPPVTEAFWRFLFDEFADMAVQRLAAAVLAGETCPPTVRAAASRRLVAERTAIEAAEGRCLVDVLVTCQVTAELLRHTEVSEFDTSLFELVIWFWDNHQFDQGAEERLRGPLIVDGVRRVLAGTVDAAALERLVGPLDDESTAGFWARWVAARLHRSSVTSDVFVTSDQFADRVADAGVGDQVRQRAAVDWALRTASDMPQAGAAIMAELAMNPYRDPDLIGEIIELLAADLCAQLASPVPLTAPIRLWMSAISEGLHATGATAEQVRLDPVACAQLGLATGHRWLGPYVADPDRYVEEALRLWPPLLVSKLIDDELIDETRIPLVPAQLVESLPPEQLGAWTAVLVALIGVDTAAWRLFCELADTFDGTIAELADVVAAALQ